MQISRIASYRIMSKETEVYMYLHARSFRVYVQTGETGKTEILSSILSLSLDIYRVPVTPMFDVKIFN